MKRTDKISVIIPCWNYGMFLKECIESVLAQTVLPHQIIIADDNSTDRSRHIATEYALEYPDLITVLLNERQYGTIENENRASQEVETEWMFFLDADDKIDPTYIEKGLKAMEEHGEKLAIVYSDMMKFGLWDGVWATSDWNPEALRTGNYINGHAFIRVSVFREIGGLRDTGSYEDHQMWVDMIDLKKEYYGLRIPEALVYYRRHDYGHRTDKTDLEKRKNI